MGHEVNFGAAPDKEVDPEFFFSLIMFTFLHVSVKYQLGTKQLVSLV